MRVVIVLLLASMVFAGCLKTAPENADDPAGDSMHQLEDPLEAYLAVNTSSNIHRLAQFGGNTAEIDASGTTLYADAGQVHLYDVSDPKNPSEIVQAPNIPDVKDVKVSDDGKWLFTGNDAQGSAQLPTGQTTASGGFYVVDVSDPTAPKIVSSLSVGPRRGPHMVFYHNTTAGDELVLGANADVSINRFDRSTGRLTELSRYAPSIVTEFNRDPEVFDIYYQGYAHDMFVMEDPVANTTLMYVANWDAGLRIVDLANPAQPREIGSWNDFPSGHSGNLHTVSTEWIGDRRITAGSVEVGFAVVGGIPYATHQERGVLYIWDTTDPANIVLLGTWENPRNLPMERDMIEGVLTSTHNLQLEQGRIYLAHYAMGIFVLDVSTPEFQAAPKLLAFHQELNDTVWDMIVVNGLMYTTGSAGITSLHYIADVKGPSGINSRA